MRTFFGDHTLPLNYSDGDQYTLDDVVPGHAEYQPYLDFDEDDDRLSDDERDADGDGLRNIDESHNAGAFDENDAPEAFRATRPSCS